MSNTSIYLKDENRQFVEEIADNKDFPELDNRSAVIRACINYCREECDDDPENIGRLLETRDDDQ